MALYRNDAGRLGMNTNKDGDIVGLSSNRTSIRERIQIRTYQDDLKYTKTVMKQSALYVGATFIAYCTLVIRAAADKSEQDNPLTMFVTTNHIFQFVDIILRPSQGCMNLVIFLYLMVYNIRRKKDADVELSEVLKLIFFGSKEEEVSECVVSGLELVRRDGALARIRYEFENRDEKEDTEEMIEYKDRALDKENYWGDDYVDHGQHDIRRIGDDYGETSTNTPRSGSSTADVQNNLNFTSFSIGGSSKSKLSAFFGSAGTNGDVVSFETNDWKSVVKDMDLEHDSKVSFDSASI